MGFSGQIDREIAQLVQLRGLLSARILELPADEQRVLILRYERNWSWTKIALRMYCDERTARRLEEHAVDALAAAVGEGNP